MKMTKKKTKRPKSPKEPSFFPEKVFNILKDKSYANLIHWNKDGTIIIITDPFKFSSEVLPKFFNHDNYSSFIKQLNTYGFHKIKNIKISKREQFKNESFTSNKTPEEIKKMKKITKHLEKIKEEIKEEIKVEINEEINEEINRQDDDKKCLEYKKLIQNGNLNNKTNKKFLEFIFNKVKEMDEFSEKANNDINEIKNQYKIEFQNIHNLNQKYNFDIKNNQYLEEKNKINYEKKTIFPIESFGCIDTRLIDEFKDVDETKIEKTNKNLGASFVEGLFLNFDSKINNYNILNNPNQTQYPSSFFNLNRTYYIE